uniref:Nuclear pore complex protein NUP205 n=1 Tax=Rhizophora mucronata TaxID=61149 RepID=A0A2P2MHY3_RHIMU
MEQINLVVGILSKAWPYEESDEFGFVQGLFGMMHALFSYKLEASIVGSSVQSSERKRMLELYLFQLCFSLSSYLYFLVTRKSLRLQVSEISDDYHSPAGVQQPTLTLLSSLFGSMTTSLERATEEKSLLLNKIRDINDLSRQEVDEIISTYVRQDRISSSDDIQKRRYVAMVEMCQVAGNRDRLITLLLALAEHVLNVFLVHFQDSSATSDTIMAIRTITYGRKPDSGQDISLLCGKLVSTLERLELLSEVKIGHRLKVFHRLVSSLKEMAIQRLT